MKKPIAALCIATVCLVAGSCKKLGEPMKPTGPLTYQAVKFPDAIPQEYGPLIGVTQNPQYPEWTALWFQRADGTITAVFVNVNRGNIFERAITIPRR